MIKKLLFGIIATLAFPMTGLAQRQGNLVVYRTDGEKISVPASELDRITFEVSEENALVAVDLGLSVKWANLNLDLSQDNKVATSPEAYGGFYGWADPYGDQTQTDVSYYPSETPPDNICGTEYDIATAQLGDGWRLPSKDEAQELIDKCTWVKSSMNGVDGFKIVGNNGNWIFLPWAGYRKGTSNYHTGMYGYYWTGTLNEKVNTFAYYLNVYDNHYAMASNIRYNGCTVRPVKE